MYSKTLILYAFNFCDIQRTTNKTGAFTIVCTGDQPCCRLCGGLIRVLKNEERTWDWKLGMSRVDTTVAREYIGFSGSGSTGQMRRVERNQCEITHLFLVCSLSPRYIIIPISSEISYTRKNQISSYEKSSWAIGCRIQDVRRLDRYFRMLFTMSFPVRNGV